MVGQPGLVGIGAMDQLYRGATGGFESHKGEHTGAQGKLNSEQGERLRALLAVCDVQ